MRLCRCPPAFCAERQDCRIAALSQQRADGAWQLLRGEWRQRRHAGLLVEKHPVTAWTRRMLEERRQALMWEIECLVAHEEPALARFLRVKRAALRVLERALARLEDG